MKTTKTKNLLLGIAIGIGTSFATVAQNVPNYVPTNGLVGWWPFNGNANDESGNNNNGTVNGATLTSDRFGNANKAYSFDGVNDFISVVDHPSIKPTNISISTWALIEQSQTGNFRRLISKQHNEPQNFASYQIITGSSSAYGQSGMTIRTGTGNSQINTGFYNWSGAFGQSITNQWQHIVGVYDGTNLKYYQNGVLVSSIPHTGGLFYNNENLLFGKGTDGVSAPGFDIFYNGKIDDIGIWNRALTQQEITDLYNANICYQTVTVTDTLIINTNLVGFNPITYQNTIKIFPNPTSDHITINYGNFATLSGYQLKIINSLGQQMFQTAINQQSSYINLSNWTGNGIYFVQIIDPQGNIIDIRKIVLQ